MTKPYNPQAIEEKWQHVWEEGDFFQQTQQQGQPVKDPMYLLFAFAYPSGSGLHVGHVESKTALDIMARYYRMQGKDVFFPVGWDAFGLPAENYAIKTGVPPAETTKNAINTFRRQLKRIGISYDWANEIATCHPGYYKWTQWIFGELYKAGLAYQAHGKVNWCPSCQTVLANEQVVNGECERCGSEVIQKDLKQWYFKITDYKDELISGLDQVDWPAPTKQQQLNWIGKSKGANVTFQLAGSDQQINTFTTRLDTIFGVTFLVISPEKFEQMQLLDQVEANKRDQVQKYIENAFKKTEEERKIGEKKKTGVDTGLQVINPVSGEEVPVYVADYVLGGYGTGAVMGVPAHDERDRSFAEKFELPIKQVVIIGENSEIFDDTVVKIRPSAFSNDGFLVNSGSFNGLSSEAAITAISEAFPDEIESTTTYKLRDWLISRQRYWGAPIPVIYDPDGGAHLVEELPWELPTDVDFKPTGESPLVSSQEFQERTQRYAAEHFAELIAEKGWAADGQGWRPEYDTMDTFVDSSWYFLRYVDARNEEQFASPEQIEKWLPVDFYMIGPEHIVLHLLYSRFFTKFLRDQGYLKFDEPFMKMRHQGMILGPDGKKMSKSKGNVINPDEVIEKFGADTLRVYEMFMGPIEADKPWDVSAVAGVYRFLRRVHDQAMKPVDQSKLDSDEAKAVQRKLHQTIRKVTQDIPDLKFNTAIAAMMEFMNTWEAAGPVLDDTEIMQFVQILAPFAPFLSEELYQAKRKNTDSVHHSAWPAWSEELAQEETVTIAVQINGKVRAELSMAADLVENQAQVLAAAKALPRIQDWLDSKQIRKEIYVPGRIVNLVVS